MKKKKKHFSLIIDVHGQLISDASRPIDSFDAIGQIDLIAHASNVLWRIDSKSHR